MITLARYCCPMCGVRENFEIRSPRKDETICHWMDCILVPTMKVRHAMLNLFCETEGLNVKIVMWEAISGNQIGSFLQDSSSQQTSQAHSG